MAEDSAEMEGDWWSARVVGAIRSAMWFDELGSELL